MTKQLTGGKEISRLLVIVIIHICDQRSIFLDHFQEIINITGSLYLLLYCHEQLLVHKGIEHTVTAAELNAHTSMSISP